MRRRRAARRQPTRCSTPSDLIAAFSDGDRRRLQRLRRRHRRLGLLRRRQRPLRRLQLLQRQQPRLGPRRGRGRGGQRRRRRHRRLPHAARSCRCASGTRSSSTRTTSRRRSLYAADNDIEVVEGAVGGLFNSRFARNAFDYAYRHGVFFAIVSSDLNTADHNIPTLYNEAMQVQGTVADVQGSGTDPPQQVHRLLQPRSASRCRRNAPIGTWFRNSGTTQYGGHAHIVMPARDRLGGDRPGLGRRRAARLLRAPAGQSDAASRTRSSSCSR